MLLSIVIPVYNSSQYLERLFITLIGYINKTDVEIIIVDDNNLAKSSGRFLVGTIIEMFSFLCEIFIPSDGNKYIILNFKLRFSKYFEQFLLYYQALH